MRAATVRPARPADLAALGEFFAALSLRSRYLRFFAAITPQPAMLRRMCGGVDGVDAVIALDGGVIVGHAMAADDAGPDRGRTTDIGVVVADRWQGRGTGSALVRELLRRAAARGVTSVTMDVLHGNHEVVAIITSHWPDARAGRGPDCLTVRAPVPPGPAGPGHGRPGEDSVGQLAPGQGSQPCRSSSASSRTSWEREPTPSFR